MKKVILYTNQKAFEADCKLYGNRLKLEKAIRNEIKILLPKCKLSANFYSNCSSNFFILLGQAYPKHLELMKAEKIPEMIDMDISKLMKLIYEYEQGDGYTTAIKPKDVKSPSIASYQILAESQEEIDQFEAIEKVIQALKEAEAVCGFKMYSGSISAGTSKWAYADLYNQELRFNHNYVLENRRKTARQKV
tara:strand:- start:151 stop:726 length:576 start_codon:yes stop_codon:yes gene_type:complete